MNDIVKRVENVLGNLDHHARCGGVFHENTGKLNPITGRAFCRLCKACVSHGRAGAFCRQAAISGAYKSLVSGDGFRFKCWLGLRGIVLPISPDGKEIIGALEIGGILFRGELQEKQHQIMSILHSIGADDNLQQFVNAFQGVDEVPEINIDLLNSFLKEALFSSGLLNSRKFSEKSAFWQQQQRIADNLITITTCKPDAGKQVLPMVSQLINDVGNSAKDDEILKKTDALISILLFDTGRDLNKLKAHCLVILSMLSAQSILIGASWSKYIPVHAIKIEELGKIDDVENLCFWVENLFRKARKNGDARSGDEFISSKVVTYLHRNYSDKITVQDLAKAVGASPSSVMHKLKSESGLTFTETLNAIRVKEAKRLLAFTSLPLGEISIRCGFKDQSYFTKIFKKNVNIGPREFRKMLVMETSAD